MSAPRRRIRRETLPSRQCGKDHADDNSQSHSLAGGTFSGNQAVARQRYRKRSSDEPAEGT